MAGGRPKGAVNESSLPSFAESASFAESSVFFAESVLCFADCALLLVLDLFTCV